MFSNNNINVNLIVDYKRKKKLQFLYFTNKYDKVSTEIDLLINEFQTKYREYISVKVSWFDFISVFKVPLSINMYTIFCFYNSLTIGIINRPCLIELCYFYERCNDLVITERWNILKRLYKYSYFGSQIPDFKIKDLFKEINKINNGKNIYNKDSLSNSNMKFLTPTCEIYQLDKFCFIYQGKLIFK